MNKRSSNIISRLALFLGALVLMLMAGSFSPAAAADEIVINGSLPVTNYRQVTLTLAPPAGSATMSFQNESGAWSPEENAAATKQWTLSAPDGAKTVSVLFKNSSGVILGNFSDTIRLDYIIDTSFFSPKGSTNYGNPGQNKTTSKSVAIQPADQKIVVVGTYDNGGGNTQLQVIRYLPDGTYDPAFGAGTGMVYFGNSTGAYSGNAVAVQPDGKIVVVGTYDMGAGKTGLWLLRLTSGGALDPAFNPALGGGYLVLGGIGDKSSGNAVKLQPDGKIIVVGTYAKSGTNNTSPWVLSFNPDGSPDEEFNETGNIVLDAAPGAHTGTAVDVDASERIVVVGTYDHGGGNTSVLVMRIDEFGAFDTTFGRPTAADPAIKLGYDTFGFNGAHTGNAVAINTISGKISVVGTWYWNSTNTDIWLLQLNSDGTLDTAFNPNPTGVPPGTVALGGNGLDSGSAVAIQSDGKVIVVGTYDNGIVAGTSLLVQRFNADGSYDTTFNNGNSAYSFGIPGMFAGRGLALQADQKIVVTGMGYGIIDNTGFSTMLTLRLFDKTWPLTVSTVGSGTVAVLPGDMTWVGSTGSASYIPGTIVQLTATPTNGATFDGWSGACSGTGPCTVTMDAAKDVTATFTIFYPLTVSVTGDGSVYSAPAGIACNSSSGPGCSKSFQSGTPVTVTAIVPWYVLNGLWSGGTCSGSINTPCAFTMDQARSVNAKFIAGSYTRVVGWGDYPTLAEAYDVAYASGPAATVQAKDSAQIVFQENLLFNQPVTVTLQGGKGSDFSAAPVGFTTISGYLKISNGRLNAGYLKIRP